ncbi:MAG: hypothetical protein K8T20_16205 [Planctomycetes bacterium]|nr:hypothetical protein [Planctomycetota bacterium]
MLEGLHPTKADLTARFGLSQRLCVRVGALLASRIELTAALLEAAKPGTPTETFLLRKEILAEAGVMGTERLQTLAADTNLEMDLVIEEQGTKRVIGLEEELAAAAEFTAPAPSPVAMGLELSPIDVDPMAALISGSGPMGTPALSSEEVGKIKLTILTGVDPKAKIEAIRKLVLTGLPQNEKGLLLLRAVSDESPEVRSEAAAGLRALGLDDATASAVRSLSDGTAPEKTAAINALARRAADAGDAEKAVVIAALAADLRGAPDPPRAAQLLRTLGDLAPHLTRNPDFAGAVVRIAVRRLFSAPPEVAEAVGEFLAKVGAVEPSLVAKILWAEAEGAPDRRSKALLHVALSRIPAAAGPERLARATATLISGWNDSDFDCRRAANALLHLGDVALDALLEALRGVPQPQVSFLVRLADQVAEQPETSEAGAERWGEALIEIVRTGRKPARIAALESRALQRASLGTKRQLALHVLTSAHDYQNDEIAHLTDAFLRRLGGAAVPELAKVLKDSPYPVEREIALRALDAILTDDTKLAKEASDSLRVMLDLYRGGKFANEPLLAKTLGRVAALSGAPQAAVRGTAMELRTMLREFPARFEILEAYSWAVSNRHVEMDQKMSAGMTLLGLLDSKMPEDFVKEAWTNDGLQLTISRSSSAHTVLIPTLVGGLVRIALSGGGTELFLEKITQGLMVHWGRIVKGEVMWSPGNVSDLGSGLGKIAARQETPLHLRLDVIEALRTRIVHVPVAKALGEALALEETSRRMDMICASVTKELCDLAVHRDFQDSDDRAALLSSLGRIAQRTRLATDGTTSEDLRRKVVELLFDGARAGVQDAREALANLVKAKGVPPEMRKAIKERIGRT